MDAGAEPIADPVQLDLVRKQARAVHLKSLAFAVVLTAVLVLV
jgi:hypothetical protein